MATFNSYELELIKNCVYREIDNLSEKIDIAKMGGTGRTVVYWQDRLKDHIDLSKKIDIVLTETRDKEWNSIGKIYYE